MNYGTGYVWYNAENNLIEECGILGHMANKVLSISHSISHLAYLGEL
jgi:hypothetical protein